MHDSLRRLAVLCLLTLSITASAEAGQRTISAKSPSCVEVAGHSQRDIDNALTFCSTIPKGSVIGLVALDSLLFIKVTREMADAIWADRPTAEYLFKSWLTGWRLISGSAAVSITLDWRNVQVAKGATTISGEDRVTIK